MITIKKFRNLVELTEYFQDEVTCRKYLELLVWNGTPVCPKCGGTKVYTFKDNKTYKCANNTCYKKFTVTVGTYFENTKISLRKWFIAIYLFTSHKRGISSCQLARDLSITQKAAWFVLSRLREVMKEKEPIVFDEKVSIDELYYAGKAVYRHANRPDIEKQPVIGIVGASGNTSFIHISEVRHSILKKLINSRIKKGNTMVTDGSVLYKFLKDNYDHKSVDHQAGVYSLDGHHTNNVEGAFSHLRRGITGTYFHASPKHLQKYCNEFAFRLSTCKQDERTRFENAIRQCAGRLKYDELTKETEFSRYPQPLPPTAIKSWKKSIKKSSGKNTNWM